MKCNYKKRKAAKDLVNVLVGDIAERDIKTDEDAEAALKDLQTRFSSFLEQVPKDEIPFLTGMSVVEGPVQSATEGGFRDA